MFSYVPSNYSVRSSTSNQPPLYGTAFFRQPSTSSLESTFEIVREDAFSKSVNLTESNSAGDFVSDLHKSVQVLPSTSGRYQIYRDSINTSKQTANKMSTRNDTNSFIYNISNPHRPKLESAAVKKSPDSKKIHVTKSTPKLDRKSPGSVSTKSLPVSMVTSTDHDFECSCKQYHSHVFLDDSINMDMVRQEQQRVRAVNDSHKSSLYLAEGTDDARNIFWTPALSFHSYKHGDTCVEFASLWPSKKELQEHLQNSGVLSTVLRGAVFELGLQAIVCGPIDLLKCLIQLCLIRVDQQFDNGSSMLHIACLSRNIESVQYLTQIGISPKIRDKHGLVRHDW
ncbi:hypothetical protein LOTGIDRAFT_175022 [Lottia gigantea]|uniref:Uncharacterized protein n=1 Tax=Lottia gigantea TaxID=225164 RepID=V4AMF9_LOTGI|nr:hypothetical protein LOTGIDRAFT_175022 [Lottia gigantea]ESO95940.1 hypothetical protein LOTGIDRAFT_175022 [Lottia gigantea]